MESPKNTGRALPEYLLKAVGQISEGILIMDSNLVVCYVNPAFEMMSGYSFEYIVGKNADAIWSQYNKEIFSESFLKSLDSEYPWKGRVANRRKDGTLYETEVKIIAVRGKRGNITHIVTVHQDPTHEILLEKQLIQAQRMQAIGTLAGGIAHDFNNILSTIMGYTEICIIQSPKESPFQKRLERIMQACLRARELVKQILTLSRQTKRKKNQVQIHLILKEALKLIRASLPSTIEIRHDIQTDSSYVMADPTQIHQVFMNLCTNAAQAMHKKGGKLFVKLEDVKLDDEALKKYPNLKPGPYVCLTVTDTGQGMDRQTMEHIFEPVLTNRKTEVAMKMGLAAVQSIVLNHGGSVYVDSEPGKGSTFKVLLPRISMDSIFEISSSAYLPHGTERILLVDDEKYIVDMVKEMLEGLGYTIVSTINSPEALKWFDQTPYEFDLVITDQTMPNITGTELADRMCNIRPDIPIILYTGYSEEIISEKTTRNIKAFIMKPFIIHELAMTVRKVLDDRYPPDSD